MGYQGGEVVNINLFAYGTMSKTIRYMDCAITSGSDVCPRFHMHGVHMLAAVVVQS